MFSIREGKCGYPWRAVGSVGGKCNGDGDGDRGEYVTRMLWKRRCRHIGKLLGRDARAMSHPGRQRRCHPSLAYKVAILALLMDAINMALENPVFESWDDSVCTMLVVERGIVKDRVLRMHNLTRVESAGGKYGVRRKGLHHLESVSSFCIPTILCQRGTCGLRVVLYASLLSHPRMIDTYADFHIRVHVDAERQMTLHHARELFTEGADIVVLCKIIREMVL